MSDTLSTTASDARTPPGGLLFVLLCVLVAAIGLMPWLMAAMFAPALLGAPGPGPTPLTILGVAAVLAYPLWLIYWLGRVRSARRAGESGRTAAAILAAPGVMLISAFSLISFGP